MLARGRIVSQFSAFTYQDDIHDYQAGEIVFSQGDAGENMYDVVEGEVLLSRDGREITRLKSGEIFGETGLINNEAHSVTATALVDCKIAKISRHRFMFMVDETPGFALSVMRVLAQRLSKETAKNNS